MYAVYVHLVSSLSSVPRKERQMCRWKKRELEVKKKGQLVEMDLSDKLLRGVPISIVCLLQMV